MKNILLLLLLAGLTGLTPPEPRPNVLLILVDDMGYGDYSMAGNPHLRTPHLDRLALQGVQFANFYVSPVCAPTRASLLTGRYHQRTGVRSVTNGFETLAPDETTLAEILSRNGYRTGLFGKWHLGENYPSLPNAQGFGEYIGFRTGHFDDYFDPVLEHNGRPYPTKGYITDVLTNEAIRFMKDAQRTKRPFFCYLPYNAPHTPLEVPEKYIGKYREKGLTENTARVYGMIENLDENVGRLREFLRQMGLAQNTVVVFLSDNGPIWRNNVPADVRYNGGLRDRKFTVYEGGIRTQCFFRWGEKLAGGKRIEPIAAHIDVLPTLLDFCRIPVPAGLAVDGKSLRPLLEPGRAVWPDRTLFLNYSLKTLNNPAPYPGGIARTQRYKMVDGTDLYDLQADPAETRNLAADQPDLLRRLDSTYRQWWQETHAVRGFRLLPVQVGHREANPAVLTPHLGRVTGSLKYLGDRGVIDGKQVIGPHPVGVDGDWISNWRSPEDQINWPVEVVAPGTYEVSLTMRKVAAASGNRVAVRIGETSLSQPLPDTGPDDWTPVVMGKADLKPGSYTLSVLAPSVRGEVGELKNIQIRKIK